jgi:undecaprenyl-diphosphatase
LGLLQGITEFLPVSSSGHLVAAQHLLGIEQPGALLEVALHVGTLAAIVIAFRVELWQLVRDGFAGLSLRLRGTDAALLDERAPLFPTALAVVVGSVPAAVAAIAIKLGAENVLDSLLSCGVCLTVTGGVLLASRWAPRATVERVGPARGIVIGLAQAAALLPGISRSGSTIVAGRFLGVEGAGAARFSFLLAVPAIAGAGIFEAYDLLTGEAAATGLSPPGPVAVGMLVSMTVGLASIAVLMRIVRSGRLHWFAAYCVPVGVVIVHYSLSGGP